jgi:predicted enzyme related to lactoylglutathione lyase
VGWTEFHTTDPERCKAFFAELLGWGYQDIQGSTRDGSCIIWSADNRVVGFLFGMTGKEQQGVPPHWMPYICVDDVDMACAEVDRLGGIVATSPFTIPGLGRAAIINDPVGATVALMESAATG